MLVQGVVYTFEQDRSVYGSPPSGRVVLVSLPVTLLPPWQPPTGRPALPHFLPLLSAHPNTSLGHGSSNSPLRGWTSGAPSPPESAVPAKALTLLTPSFLGN